MKKIIVLTLIATMAFSLCACGGSHPTEEEIKESIEESIKESIEESMAKSMSETEAESKMEEEWRK